jgi:hypothetical protein
MHGIVRTRRKYMSKSKILLSIAGFVLAAFAVAMPVQAGPGGNDDDDEEDEDNGDDEPDGDCPTSKLYNWKLVQNEDAKCSFEAEYTDEEGNQDGYVCERWKKGQLNYRDNDK